MRRYLALIALSFALCGVSIPGVASGAPFDSDPPETEWLARSYFEMCGNLTPSECETEMQASTTDNGSTRVEVFEDGSGVQLVNGMYARTFEAGTFAWDCSVHGNGVCGPVLPRTECAHLIWPHLGRLCSSDLAPPLS